ncbi:DUF397 domain-containing protein [Kitasatospora xanthocidica]|uniref:DUF397 domain-containing protein n=1 Tax=Kitasatospora xanthocidica TaxID=83382 RepID=A0A372ZL21_9ACTN|nr:DUF397 domain-containing protein [Kitasatospora xanthocidica]RGD56568.1 DUF397 domain-containing protein [Kitasatospora xanthocidica]
MGDGTTLDQGGYCWAKSSYSSSENGDCVEVGRTVTGAVPVRDTKQHRRGPVLEFTPVAFQGFLNAVKAGEFPVQL